MVESHMKHRVLLIGSGLMTPPLVDYLVKFGDTSITVASNIQKDAEKIAARHSHCMKALYLDVLDVSLSNSS
jgi:saccharopine dehydrogenase-like NADP-dependent oxidoreductase